MRSGAFETALERHQRRVFSFVYYMLGQREEAEDVTQEVFIRLWGHQEVLASDRVETWLLRVARNACIDRIRRRRLTRGIFASEPPPASREPAGSRTADPEVRLLASEYSSSVQAALGSLSEQLRSVVVLREIQGLSYRRISEVLEIDLSLVRARLHRGRRALRERLREVYADAAAC
jgi:RNA polymerase sigma-70 factor (ECF subfamily)